MKRHTFSPLLTACSTAEVKVAEPSQADSFPKTPSLFQQGATQFHRSWKEFMLPQKVSCKECLACLQSAVHSTNKINKKIKNSWGLFYFSHLHDNFASPKFMFSLQKPAWEKLPSDQNGQAGRQVPIQLSKRGLGQACIGRWAGYYSPSFINSILTANYKLKVWESLSTVPSLHF